MQELKAGIWYYWNMNKVKLAIPKGFRDFLPSDAIRRKIVMDKIIAVFAKFGFDPLETPTLEYAKTLKGKYGEEEKLIYEFKTKGGDEVALRYDQTVPLARVVTQYPNLPKPFKRYQIQSAYRGEKPQKGRYREFLQCDADIVGENNPLADAEILALVYEIYKELGLDILIKINDRSLLVNIEPIYLSSIDKLLKIGAENVLKELEGKGLSSQNALNTLNQIKSRKPSKNLDDIVELYTQLGYPKDSIKFDPTLVRGLDYYTGLIFEVVPKSDPTLASLCGGGRWDKMIGAFTGVDQPAAGFAIGFDRTLEAMKETGVLDILQTNTKVLVTVFSSHLIKKSLEIASYLRSKDINTEVWLDPNAKLDKQLKYADQKGIPYAVIIGPDEAEKNEVTLKSLKFQTQQKISLDELAQTLSS